jgi:two-component system, OmpR family, phosphate regulon response regulator OmpR
MAAPKPEAALADDAPHLLVVDDDRRIRDLLSRFLLGEGYRVTTAESAAEARAKLAGLRFDLMILDVMMPGETGFEFARSLRGSANGPISNVPILMLTARGEEMDRIVGLEIGADDYLPKPFSPRELQARLRAILRRGRTPAREADAGLRFGRLQIDRSSRMVRIDGEEKILTSFQFDLLAALADNSGRVLNRERLMDLVKGEEFDAFDRSIDVHISRIRALIEDDPRHPRRIITVRGAGYVFARKQDDEA